MLTHAPWAAVCGLRHGFLDRRECGGRPWDEVVAAVGAPLPISVPRQVHGTRVARAARATDPPVADALVSAEQELLVGIVTADCAPVLLVDPRRRAVAVVHAGWRGAAAGVVEAAVDRLRTEFGVESAGLTAVIGPAVGGCCYEVGTEVLDGFRARTGETTAPAWSTRGTRRYLDLRAAVRFLLGAAGVGAVHTLGPCTACGEGFHSYRRDGARTGRQLSFVGWA